MDRMAVTGGAGFIGSNLAEFLLGRGHDVVVIDNFTTGKAQNLAGWPVSRRAEIVQADINDTGRLQQVFRGVRYVFHQAAIPSVPRSVADPQATNSANVDGTLSVLVAARDAGVERVVVASSSSVYGDDENLPKVEDRLGKPLSPYALSKVVCEEYARLFFKLFKLETVCLRYFNVFGPRQDPSSQYAAVVPRFVCSMLDGHSPVIFGDGEQTRDFTFVANVVEANWAAATHPAAAGEVFNIGCGEETSLNVLVAALNDILGVSLSPAYALPRVGDVRHSVADVSKARRLMGYSPTVTLRQGLERVIDWYRAGRELANGTA